MQRGLKVVELVVIGVLIGGCAASPKAEQVSLPSNDAPVAAQSSPPSHAAQVPLPSLDDPEPASSQSWAHQMIEGLSAVQVPEPHPPGAVKFQLTVCRDGRHRAALADESASAQNESVADAMATAELPPIPKDVQARMQGTCAPVRYTFTWEDGRVR